MSSQIIFRKIRNAIHTLAVIKNYNNEFLTIWENAHVIIYNAPIIKKNTWSVWKRKLYQIITKSLYSDEWSHCKIFFFFGLFFQIKGGYSQKHIHPPFIKKNEKKQAA